MDQSDCGAVALGIILRYYGCVLPMHSLRKQCGLSRSGTSVHTVAQIANQYGMKSTLQTGESTQDVMKHSFPLIIFWENKHFVVLEGFKGETVYINNPSVGRCKITKNAFEQSFSGVSLQFEPTEHFKRCNLEKSCMTYCLELVRENYTALSFLTLSTLILALPGLVIPIFSRLYVDRFFIAHKDHNLSNVFLLLILMLGVQLVLTYQQRKFLRKFECKLATQQVFRLIQIIMDMPIFIFTHRKAGTLNHCLQSSDRFAETLIGPLFAAYTNTIQMMIYLGFMFWCNAWLSGLVCTMALIHLTCIYLTKESRAHLSSQTKQELANLTTATLNSLAMMAQLKSVNSERDFFSQWQHKLTAYLNPYRSLSFLNGLLTSLTAFILAIFNIALVIIGIIQINNHALSIGDFIAFNGLLVTFNVLLIQLVSLGGQFQLLQADYDRISDVFNPDTAQLKKKARTTNHPILYASPNCKGKVELINVTFGYSEHEGPILRDFSMIIEPRTRVAVVGASGSGKSTLAKLISGLYEPWSGKILIDGVCLSKISAEERAQLIGLVNQEQFFFKGTLQENLSLWAPYYSQNELIQATQMACIEELLQTADGLDYQLMEGASNLSGGQRQRLEIARAFLANPTILILDEAMSSLDTLVECQVDKNIRACNKTLLIIAHRFNTIMDADVIHVMKRGQIIDSGSHCSLMSKNSSQYIEFLKKSG